MCVCVCVTIVLVMFKCVVFKAFSLHFKLEMYFNFIVFCVIKQVKIIIMVVYFRFKVNSLWTIIVIKQDQ